MPVLRFIARETTVKKVKSMRSVIILVTAVAVAALSLLLAGILTAHAFDNGQYNNVDPKVRDWFKSVRSRNGIPCCDIADGHSTTWRGTSEGGYEVPIEGEWRHVPPEAIVYNAGNPTGEAVVWFVRQGVGIYHIRCFVLGAGG